MNRLSMLYDQLRESRIAIAVLGGGLAVILFGTLLFLTSHTKPGANAADASYDGVSQTTLPTPTIPGQRANTAANTASTTTTTAPDPTPNKSTPDDPNIVEEFDTQIPDTTLGPNGEVPPREGTASTPMSGSTTAIALDVSVKFVQEWANTNRPRSAWIAGMSQYATQTFMDGFADVDPSVIPQVKVTGAATVLSDKNPIEISVPTDQGKLLITISSTQLTSGYVKVIDIQPQDTDNGSFGSTPSGPTD